MNGMGKVLSLGILAGALLAGTLEEEVRIIEREARVRADKRKFGETLLTLTEGASVAVVATESPWVRVRKDGIEGWLHETAITRDKNYVFSGSGVGMGVEASEQSAAQKGFDKLTEKNYRASKPALEASFKLVDSIDAKKPDDEAVAEFVEDGRLQGGEQ